MKYPENNIKNNSTRLKAFAKWFIEENKVLLKEVNFINQRENNKASGYKYFFERVHTGQINDSDLLYVINENIRENGLHYTIPKLYNTIFGSNFSIDDNVTELNANSREVNKKDLDNFFGDEN